MSAEKCGGTLTFEILQKAANLAISKGLDVPLPILSVKACRMLKKIQHKFPDFQPLSEADIWYKAYKMGLTEEE